LLADEYIDGSGANCRGTREPSQANATRETQRDAIKWRDWIADSTRIPTTTLAPATPGLYDGANHCPSGIYRPTYDSKMRSLGRPFEQVNTEQLVRRFYNFVSPIDAISPLTPAVTIKRGQPAAFSVQRPQPATHDLSVAWSIDGRELGLDASLTIDTSVLAPGRYTIEVTVRDQTELVRSDPNEALVERVEWTLEIVP
jgi:hypothetical protein